MLKVDPWAIQKSKAKPALNETLRFHKRMNSLEHGEWRILWQ